MRYDKAWLESVHSTRTLISTLNGLIPGIREFRDRAVIRQQFEATREEFEGQIERGYDISHARRCLLDLMNLTLEVGDGCVLPR